MPNNTAFFSYLEDQLEGSEFRKEFAEAYEKAKENSRQIERSQQMIGFPTEKDIVNRSHCESVIIGLVNEMGMESFFLGLSDAFYGDDIDDGTRRMRRALDGKLEDLCDLVQGE